MHCRIASSTVWKILLLAMAMTGAPAGLFAQTQAKPDMGIDRPAFAVSVVKSSGPGSANRSIHFLPGGRFTAQGVNVRLLIKIAYNLNDDELTGGPSWIGLKHFDVDATPDSPDGGTVNMDRSRLRLQALLADRFQLQMRDEMKTMSTYALVVAKGGPKLRKSQAQGAPMQAHANNGAMLLTNASMEDLANATSDWVGHPVLNQTAIEGKYDLRLEWTPDQPATPAGSADTASLPNASGPTIFTALQQQLGLSLESRKNQALCKVIEHVEFPAEN